MLSSFKHVVKRWSFTRQMPDVVDLVDAEIARWTQEARMIPFPDLRKQALASLSHKRFHAEGGSLFAVLAGDHWRSLVRAIVAYQSISDYLDNLCDRGGRMKRSDYRRWHRSLDFALDPALDLEHLDGPFVADGGYLAKLVHTCQKEMARWPGGADVRATCLDLSRRYRHLQVDKHGPRSDRETRLKRRFQSEGRPYPQLEWWEYQAATGSTLGIYCLWTYATRGPVSDCLQQRILEAYFPWICGLHILLDYFIDQREDRKGGDLNLVSFYPSQDDCVRRLNWFIRHAQTKVEALPDAPFHQLVIEGLPALYLSDPKVDDQQFNAHRRQLLSRLEWSARLLYRFYRLRRWFKGQHRVQEQAPPSTAG